MFDSPVIETLLSLTLLMLFFSILVSCVQEGYVHLRKSRGKMLEYAIREVLSDTFNKDFAHLVYQHPQVDLLREKQGGLPSYIGADAFARALIESIARECTESVYAEAPDKSMMIKAERFKPEAVRACPDIAIRYGLDPKEEHTLAADRMTVPMPLQDRFLLGIRTMHQSPLKDLLLSFAANAPNATGELTLASLQAEIATWYDDYMMRVTGWYKRTARKNILFFSIAVCVILNLNFIRVSKTIYADSKLRDVLAQTAVRVAGQDDAIDSIRMIFMLDSLDLMDIDANALLGVQLPIGWSTKPLDPHWKSSSWLCRNLGTPGCLFHMYIWRNLLGWLLFALGLSLGAPFWFDVLNKFVNVRNAGIKPAARHDQ
jgi:hypothetical protein